MKKQEASKSLFCSRVHVGEVRMDGGRTQPCCRVYRTKETEKFSILKYRRYLSKKLQAGIRVKDCEACWAQERAGNRSYRADGAELVTDEERERLEKDPLYVLPIRHLEVILSNGCNYACQMCGPRLSTKWQSLIKSKNLFKEKELYSAYRLPSQLLKRTSQRVPAKQLEGLRVIKLMGGEPFYARETNELLESIDRMGIAPNLTLETPTNCSVFPTPRQQEILKKFKCLKIGTSFDGVGELNDWIRHGSKWDVAIENFIKWVKFVNSHHNGMAGSAVNISCTVTILNVNKITEIYKFFRKYLPANGISTFPAFYPYHLSISNLKKRDVEPMLGHLGLQGQYMGEKIHRSNAEEIRERLETRVMTDLDKIRLRGHMVNIEKMTGKTLMDVNPYMGKIVSELVA